MLESVRRLVAPTKFTGWVSHNVPRAEECPPGCRSWALADCEQRLAPNADNATLSRCGFNGSTQRPRRTPQMVT